MFSSRMRADVAQARMDGRQQDAARSRVAAEVKKQSPSRSQERRERRIAAAAGRLGNLPGRLIDGVEPTRPASGTAAPEPVAARGRGRGDLNAGEVYPAEPVTLASVRR